MFRELRSNEDLSRTFEIDGIPVYFMKKALRGIWRALGDQINSRQSLSRSIPDAPEISLPLRCMRRYSQLSEPNVGTMGFTRMRPTEHQIVPPIFAFQHVSIHFYRLLEPSSFIFRFNIASIIKDIYLDIVRGTAPGVINEISVDYEKFKKVTSDKARCKAKDLDAENLCI